MLNGSVDKITCEGAVGWFFNKALEGKPAVEAVLHDRVIGHAVADHYRPDLEEVGFGDGRCGFEIKFFDGILQNYLPFVTVRPQGYNLSIPLTANAVFLDLTATLLKSFPGAGRNRSIFGGLWTDRLDAFPLLSGRIGMGLCAPDLQPSLQNLITHGYIQLSNVFGTDGPDKRKLDIAQTIAGLPRATDKDITVVENGLWELVTFIFQQQIVKTLQAVFDDQPIAYRLEWLTEPDAVFSQVSTIELLPSPAECLALYFGGSDGEAKIDFIRDSHEMPEFTQQGKSRWVEPYNAELSQLVISSGASLDSISFNHHDAIIVGPGLIHRCQATQSAPILRIICAPKRITPQRFLTGNDMWIEASHPAGARIRL